jgi:predicted peroxiredoxin
MAEKVKKPQLAHTARQMFETRLAKYNDPRNLEWDFDDITDKWERHAWSAFLDLQATEAERDALLSEVAQLKRWVQNIFDSGVEFEDSRISYKTMQIEKSDLEEGLALVKGK